MNIKKFTLTGNSFEWIDLAHDDTIRFVLADEHFIDCKIDTDRHEPVLCITTNAFDSELRILPTVSNAIKVGFTHPLATWEAKKK